MQRLTIYRWLWSRLTVISQFQRFKIKQSAITIWHRNAVERIWKFQSCERVRRDSYAQLWTDYAACVNYHSLLTSMQIKTLWTQDNGVILWIIQILLILLLHHLAELSQFPTNPFTIAEPHDQEISEFYVVEEHRVTDFEPPKLWKGSSRRVLEV